MNRPTGKESQSTARGIRTAWWYWLISLIVAVLIAWLCARIAGSKGSSPVLFGILGFFFWLITLIVVLVLPSKTTA